MNFFWLLNVSFVLTIICTMLATMNLWAGLAVGFGLLFLDATIKTYCKKKGH